MFVRQFLFLNQVYGLRRDKVSLGCDKKILILFYYLSIIIIFTAFRLATSAFMFLFIWPPPRDPRIARLFLVEKILTPKMAKNGQNLAIFGQNSHF